MYSAFLELGCNFQAQFICRSTEPLKKLKVFRVNTSTKVSDMRYTFLCSQITLQNKHAHFGCSQRFLSWAAISILNTFLLKCYDFTWKISWNHIYWVNYIFLWFQNILKIDVSNLVVLSFSWLRVGPPDLCSVRSF